MDNFKYLQLTDKDEVVWMQWLEEQPRIIIRLIWKLKSKECARSLFIFYDGVIISEP